MSKTLTIKQYKQKYESEKRKQLPRGLGPNIGTEESPIYSTIFVFRFATSTTLMKYEYEVYFDGDHSYYFTIKTSTRSRIEIFKYESEYDVYISCSVVQNSETLAFTKQLICTSGSEKLQLAAVPVT